LNHTWIPHVNNLRPKLIDGKAPRPCLCLMRRILAAAKVS
jgi:hypothetical protein